MNNSKISYKSYYKKLGITFSAASILWVILYCTIRRLKNKAWSRTVSAIEFIILILFIGLVFFVSANVNKLSRKRDKEDELYKENKNKTNQTFINFLTKAGEWFIIIGLLLKKFEFKIDYYLTIGVIYMLYGIYNFTAMHYEEKYDEDSEENDI